MPTPNAHIRQDAEDVTAGLPPLMVEARQLADAMAMGIHGRRKSGIGETFWQYRPFVTGDSSTQIDWRQSARADRLYVRETEWEIVATVWLWRDKDPSLNYSSSQKTPQKGRRGDVIAAALAALLSRGGEQVGLIGSGQRPFTGRAALDRFVESLEADPSSDTTKLPPPLPARRQSTGTGIGVYISDFFTDPDKLETQLRAAASNRTHGHLLQVIDPAEVNFPFKGRTEFLNHAGGPSLLFGNAAAISGAYKKKFAAHQSFLRDVCGNIGWTFTTHITDQPAQTALMALYSSLTADRKA